MQINIPPPKQDTAVAWAEYIRALWQDQENDNRKASSKIVVDYYKNKQKSYLEDELKKIYTDPASLAKKRKWTQNITKQVIDALAQVYSCDVNRSIPSLKSKKSNKTLDNKLFQGINKKMRNANKWLVLERTTLLFARWSAKHERINYRSYHQFEFDVVVDSGSADQELMAVILSDYKPATGGVQEDTNLIIYTHNNTFWFKGTNLQRQLAHNLGVLPFVLIHSEDPGFDDYLEPDIQLINSNLEINIAMSNLLNIHQGQVHAVPVITLPSETYMSGVDDSNPNEGSAAGLESDRRLDIHDESKALELHYGESGEVPDFKFVSPSVNFSGAVETIKYVVNSLSQTYGVDNGIFNIEVSGNPATIFHINEKRREAIVGDLKEIFIDAEKELFKIAYTLARMSDPTIPTVEPEDFDVEFTSDASIVDQLKSADVVKLYETGVIDQVEVIRHHYGDKSRPEAEAFILDLIITEKRIQDEREKIMGSSEPTEPIEE